MIRDHRIPWLDVFYRAEGQPERLGALRELVNGRADLGPLEGFDPVEVLNIWMGADSSFRFDVLDTFCSKLKEPT